MNPDSRQPLPEEIHDADKELKSDALTPEKISFNEQKNTLLLDIGKSAVDLDSLRDKASQSGFEAKNEFHITVLGFKNGREIQRIIASLPETEQPIVATQIKSLSDSVDWGFSLEPKRFHISKDYVFTDRTTGQESKERRESYVQLVNLPGVESFYKALNAILGSNLEAPPAHITLYTGGTDKEKSKMGIGINSQAEFLKLNPEAI